ncbi:hypothetical protein ACVXHB_03865 [Escherichia coli]
MLNMEYQLTLNWPDFLERHWQKRPVVLKRGFNILLTQSLQTSWRVWRWKAKLTVDWSVTRMANGRSATARSKAGHISVKPTGHYWVQAVNHWHEPTAALMRPFRELPEWRIDTSDDFFCTRRRRGRI